MIARFCIALLERILPAAIADHVVGDLVEQQQRGTWWMLRQTSSAVIHLRDHAHHGDGIVRTFLSDMRFATRQLRRAPAFAIATVVTLGLAIGATASIFSVVDPVLLRPLPYPTPDRLVFAWERTRDGGRDNVGFLTAQELGERSSTIERWAVIGSWEPTLGDTDPERVRGDRVSWTYFRTLGVQPAIGRDFLADEDQPGKNLVVILSHRLWMRRFGGDSSIVGHAIAINGNQYHVAGVMPASFDNVVSPTAEIWRVLGYAATQPFACRTCHHLRMVARLKPGVSEPAARAEFDGLHAQMVRASPKEYASVGMSLVRLQDEAARSFRSALLAIAGAVTLVLLIAVANVVNLQLARAVRREEEFAIRVALGAGRWRLTRQLLAEGLVLAMAGGIASAFVAWISLPLLVSHLPQNLPRLAAIHFDFASASLIGVAVLSLAVVMAVITGGRRDSEPGTSLRAAKRLAAGRRHVTRSTLVVAEVSLAMMLLVSANLMAKSLVHLLAVDTGFNTAGLLTMEVDAVGARYNDNAAIFSFHDRVRDAVRALPGVVGVGITNQLPLGGDFDAYGVIDADNPPANPELVPNGDRYVVSTDYLATMRIPILAGRAFTAAENRDSTTLIALVSAALAARVWPGENPIGKRFRVGGPEGPIRTVIGVTGNVKHSGLDEMTDRQWYVPERQWVQADNQIILVVRTKADPASLAPSVRRAIASIDAAQPVIRIATMDQVIARSTAQQRLALVLFAAFALAAVLLAVAGIYGVLAGSVAERTREIGLRSALGATPTEIVALILRQGGVLGTAGIMLGLAGAVGMTRYLRTLLFDVAPTDPATLLGVAGTLAVVTVAACVIPAIRALRVDPSQALRSEA